MKVSELREKTEDALQAELTAARREHFNLRMLKATQQEKSHPDELKLVRRHIARVLTILREKKGEAKS